VAPGGCCTLPERGPAPLFGCLLPPSPGRLGFCRSARCDWEDKALLVWGQGRGSSISSEPGDPRGVRAWSVPPPVPSPGKPCKIRRGHSPDWQGTFPISTAARSARAVGCLAAPRGQGPASPAAKCYRFIYTYLYTYIFFSPLSSVFGDCVAAGGWGSRQREPKGVPLRGPRLLVPWGWRSSWGGTINSHLGAEHDAGCARWGRVRADVGTLLPSLGGRHPSSCQPAGGKAVNCSLPD